LLICPLLLIIKEGQEAMKKIFAVLFLAILVLPISLTAQDRGFGLGVSRQASALKTG
jgi:hypothetical protein